MEKAIIYGKNGSADEAYHYSKLFPEDKADYICKDKNAMYII